MKAIVYYRHGSPDVLKYEEIEKPTPGDDEVLIKVGAASVNPLDWHLMKGIPYVSAVMVRLGKSKMMRPGVDVAGQVEAVGRNVTQFKPGDEVFGNCPGALAEYACAKESKLAIKPDNVTFEQAASAPVAATTALQALRDKGRIRPGHKVLINGAAGGVGTFAVQIAKSFGAQVTGVCGTRNVEVVRSIGADHAIDYTHEDFTTRGERYDLILDSIANHSVAAFRRVLNPTGVCVLVGGPNEYRSMMGLAAHWVSALSSSWFSNQKFVIFVARTNHTDTATIGELMSSGKVKPVIDRRYSLPDAPDAIRYLGTGHARGKLVIQLI